MRRELGFTTRLHQHWVNDGDLGSGYRITMYLDFYDDAAETFFNQAVNVVCIGLFHFLPLFQF
jgi:hypothetical protein